jgi:micrococcal nuclease
MIDLHCYQAKIKSAYDGDTITVDIDLGFDCWLFNQKVRLLGVNTPELKGKGAQYDKAIEARNFIAEKLLSAIEIRIKTELDKKQRDSFGRILGHVWLLDNDGKWTHLNKEILDSGHGIVFNRKRKN